MRRTILAALVGVLGVGSAPAFATPITFSNVSATVFETNPGQNPTYYYPSYMIDGVTTETSNGWAIASNDRSGDYTQDQSALFTLATPLAPQAETLTFNIYEERVAGGSGSGYELGDFSLGYATDISPTLSSAETLFTIASVTSANGTTFSSPSPTEILAGGPHPAVDIYTVTVLVDPTAPITGIFLNAIDNPNNGLPTGGPGRASDGDFVITQFTADVPEPGSILLFSTGLAGLALARHRRRRSDARRG